jgi:hypothetical protein
VGFRRLSSELSANGDDFCLSPLMQETVEEKRKCLKTESNKGKSRANLFQTFCRQGNFSTPQCSVKRS